MSTTDTKRRASRAIDALSTLRHELGSLDRVTRIVKVFGVVNATADFMQHTQVINGASDLLLEVFGEAGEHARLAIGGLLAAIQHRIGDRGGRGGWLAGC